jgi:hypothetical protein
MVMEAEPRSFSIGSAPETVYHPTPNHFCLVPEQSTPMPSNRRGGLPEEQ